MSFLLDTNVLIEAIRKQPHSGVLDWMGAQSETSLFISVITLGELLQGALLLPAGKKTEALLDWIENRITPQFGDRILPLDTAVMKHWAQLQARCGRAGCKLPAIDSLIAATALSHGLTLVTRNTADFRAAKVPLLNPWEV